MTKTISTVFFWEPCRSIISLGVYLKAVVITTKAEFLLGLATAEEYFTAQLTQIHRLYHVMWSDSGSSWAEMTSHFAPEVVIGTRPIAGF